MAATSGLEMKRPRRVATALSPQAFPTAVMSMAGPCGRGRKFPDGKMGEQVPSYTD